MALPDAHRLPRHVLPSAYRLHIDTALDDGSFEGTVEITAEVVDATDVVVCNALGLEIASARVTADGTAYGATVDVDAEAERVTFGVPATLHPGPVTIDVAFRGAFNDQLVGYYRSSFTVDGRPDSMGVTQFEAPHARRAFPCWDEPDFKATFTISLTCDERLTAVSNSAETARTSLGDGRVRFDFAPTMVMSTYLVAWVVGELEVSETVRGGTTDIRVLHRPGQGHLTAFALECAAHAVAWFEDYYDIEYPGDKLDLVAVPDFAFGAMENLGCVTFRENLLLIDPERANRSEQERAATVIEHEIAHMWFGDLVTMRWWNGIWLNEAFATFMEFCCADSFRPDWDVWTSFGLSKTAAFDTDGLAHTRPIEYEVVTPADAEGMFDILTYEKGASVLRMFEQWAGPDAFRDGVRRYLRQHSYGNTETVDLWAALSDATGVDVPAMMNTWILQGGHPVVSASTEGSAIHLSQERFRFAGGDPADDATWIVPVHVAGETADGAFDITALLDGPSLAVDTGAGTPTWYTVNAGFDGFYRSLHHGGTPAHLDRAVDQLTAVDRYAFVDDAWAMFLAGRLDLADMARTLRAVTAVETEASVWRRIAGVLGALATVTGADDHDALASFARELIGDRLAGRGDASTAADRDLSAVLFRLAGTIGRDGATIAEARRLFADPTAAGDDPDLDTAALEVVAYNGTADDFDRVVEMFRDASTPQDELRALGALASFPDAGLTARLCDMCATEVRTQNAPFVLAQAMGNRVAGEQVWQFVSSRWDELVPRFPSSSIIRMVGGVRAFSEERVVAEVEAFFTTHEVPQASLTLQQHLERLRVNAETRRRLSAAGRISDQLT